MTHQHQHRLARGLGTVAVLVAAALTVLAPSPASAHATLVDSSPRDGQRLDDLPARVRFEFSEAMASASVIVTAPDGTSATVGDPQVEGAVVSQDVTDGQEGTYTMAYRVYSEDGHPVSGEITFAVGATDASAVPAEPGPSAAAAGDRGVSTGATSTQAPPEGTAERRRVAVGVGVGLFLLAGAMLLLARRTAP